MAKRVRRHLTPHLFRLAKKLDANPRMRSALFRTLGQQQPSAPAPSPSAAAPPIQPSQLDPTPPVSLDPTLQPQ